MKRYIIAALALLVVVGGATAAYVIVQHNHDVAQAKAHAKAVRQARIDKINREYRANLVHWRADEAAWQRKNDAYEKCKTATADALDAADEVNGVISTGGSRDEYVEPIKNFGTAIAKASRETDDNFECLAVTLKLSKAQDQWIDATNIWLGWINGDNYQWIDKIDDLPMDKHFTKGSDYVNDAQAKLSDMEPGTEPVKPERGGGYLPPLDILSQ